jgi:hypothetical protein
MNIDVFSTQQHRYSTSPSSTIQDNNNTSLSILYNDPLLKTTSYGFSGLPLWLTLIKEVSRLGKLNEALPSNLSDT